MTTATNRLNLLLSEILQTDSSSSNNPISQAYSNQSPALLTFAEHDHSSSSSLPAAAPLPPRRTTSSLKNHRRHQRIDQRNIENSHQARPLLNSSTLDDLFHALTLECEQYLADSSPSSYQNETYGQLVAQPSTIPIQIDSNDDDYENLNSTRASLTSSFSLLKTSIEVLSPEKRQVISVNVSSKKLPTPNVSSSQTYPLIAASVLPATNRCSSEDELMDASSSSVNHKRRRRRTRKQQQQFTSTANQSSSSDDERTERMEKSINGKKPSVSKRSCSTDHRQQRIRSFYDNHPVSMPAGAAQRIPPRRTTRRRDISLQQPYFPNSTRASEERPRRFNENLCSPLSVLLTSTRSTSDFVDRSQPRRSRLEHAHQKPLSLLDRMHQQFYRSSPVQHPSSIPTHRIPPYPVY